MNAKAPQGNTDSRNASPSLSSQIIKEIIIPELEKEVNTGKNFAPLRQIFNSIILANWYKDNLKTALVNQVYSNKNTVKGVNLSDPSVTGKIYEQYLQAYKKGVFNYIKEEAQPNGSSIPKKYFSGGFGQSEAVIHPKVVKNATQAMVVNPRLGQSSGKFAKFNVVLDMGQKGTSQSIKQGIDRAMLQEPELLKYFKSVDSPPFYAPRVISALYDALQTNRTSGVGIIRFMTRFSKLSPHFKIVISSDAVEDLIKDTPVNQFSGKNIDTLSLLMGDGKPWLNLGKILPWMLDTEVPQLRFIIHIIHAGAGDELKLLANVEVDYHTLKANHEITSNGIDSFLKAKDYKGLKSFLYDLAQYYEKEGGLLDRDKIAELVILNTTSDDAMMTDEGQKQTFEYVKDRHPNAVLIAGLQSYFRNEINPFEADQIANRVLPPIDDDTPGKIINALRGQRFMDAAWLTAKFNLDKKSFYFLTSSIALINESGVDALIHSDGSKVTLEELQKIVKAAFLLWRIRELMIIKGEAKGYDLKPYREVAKRNAHRLYAQLEDMAMRAKQDVQINISTTADEEEVGKNAELSVIPKNKLEGILRKSTDMSRKSGILLTKDIEIKLKKSEGRYYIIAIHNVPPKLQVNTAIPRWPIFGVTFKVKDDARAREIFNIYANSDLIQSMLFALTRDSLERKFVNEVQLKKLKEILAGNAAMKSQNRLQQPFVIVDDILREREGPYEVKGEDGSNIRITVKVKGNSNKTQPGFDRFDLYLNGRKLETENPLEYNTPIGVVGHLLVIGEEVRYSQNHPSIFYLKDAQNAFPVSYENILKFSTVGESHLRNSSFMKMQTMHETLGLAQVVRFDQQDNLEVIYDDGVTPEIQWRATTNLQKLEAFVRGNHHVNNQQKDNFRQAVADSAMTTTISSSGNVQFLKDIPYKKDKIEKETFFLKSALSEFKGTVTRISNGYEVKIQGMKEPLQVVYGESKKLFMIVPNGSPIRFSTSWEREAKEYVEFTFTDYSPNSLYVDIDNRSTPLEINSKSNSAMASKNYLTISEGDFRTAQPHDNAMSPGGIDLNSANMGMTVTKDANGGVQVNFDPAMIERIRKDGVQSVVPVIINVSPMTSSQLMPLLGLAPRNEKQEHLVKA